MNPNDEEVDKGESNVTMDTQPKLPVETSESIVPTAAVRAKESFLDTWQGKATAGTLGVLIATGIVACKPASGVTESPTVTATTEAPIETVSPSPEDPDSSNGSEKIFPEWRELSSSDIEIEMGLPDAEYAEKFIEMYSLSYTYTSNETVVSAWLDVDGGAAERDAYLYEEAKKSSKLFYDALYVEGWDDGVSFPADFDDKIINETYNNSKLYIGTYRDSVKYKSTNELVAFKRIGDSTEGGRIIDITYVHKDNIGEISKLSDLQSADGKDATIRLTTVIEDGVEKVSKHEVIDYL